MANAANEPSGGRVGLRPETLLSSLAVVLVVSVVQRSIGFGRAVLVCRWLDPDELGNWEMAYGFLILAAPLAVLGLPGSFGRYLERYRQAGQLRMFLTRTASWTLVLAGSTIALMAWRADLLASLVFGEATSAGLAQLVLGCLAIVIVHHFYEAVFAGLRMYRVVSAMQFVQSMSFAAIAITLITAWRPVAASIVLGYAGGCLVSIFGVSIWSVLHAPRDGDRAASVKHREFWPPLVRFAVWIWVTNLLTNLFSTCDRYMIIHFGGFGPEEALAQVGNYHTSSIVPILLVSVANLVVGAMTPHLSHDWEAGRRDAVSARLNLTIKLGALAMLGVGVLVLLFCPLLFRHAFGGKYEAGLAVLPWTLSASVWFGLLLIAQQYAWCAERSRSATLPLVVGLVANVVMNLVLLPIWGLLGAVMATAIATLLTAIAQLALNWRLGMRVHRGTVLVLFAPALLTLGPAVSAAGLTVLLGVAIARGWVLTDEEREEIVAVLTSRAGPIAARLRRAT